jgi:SAM-dependent methyltransferase
MKQEMKMHSAVDLYDTSYDNFSARVQAEVRAATYGEDLGQSSWMTADELRKFIRWLKLKPSFNVLEMGSGSGGPALFVARTIRCSITGLDINEHGVRNANELARQQKIEALARFQLADAGQTLPFTDNSFDAIFSNDAMCHVPRRADVLRDWFRVLKPGGRMLFTDAMIISGLLSNDEIATRSSIGKYFFLPHGENERLIQATGFKLVRVDNVTASAMIVAKRWHDARAQRRKDLVRIEGKANFDGLQEFLWCVHTVSAESRLSRFVYVAKKPNVARFTQPKRKRRKSEVEQRS